MSFGKYVYHFQNDSILKLFGRWICREYNARHFREKRLYHFRVIFLIEDQPLGGPRTNRRSEELWEHVCYEKKATV